MTDRTPRLRDFLDHLLEAIARIERYVAPLDFTATAPEVRNRLV